MTLIQTLAAFCAQYLIFILLAVAGIWFLWRTSREQKKDLIIFAAISLPLTFVLGLLAARLLYDPRPFMVDHIAPLISHEPSNGFPSHHTLLAAAAACIMWRANRRLGIVLFAMASLVGLSRIYAHVHHLIDVIGAAGIAIAAALFTVQLIKIITSRRKDIYEQ
jgi:undecaprenyl-diphosphatase